MQIAAHFSLLVDASVRLSIRSGCAASRAAKQGRSIHSFLHAGPILGYARNYIYSIHTSSLPPCGASQQHAIALTMVTFAQLPTGTVFYNHLEWLVSHRCRKPMLSATRTMFCSVPSQVDSCVEHWTAAEKGRAVVSVSRAKGGAYLSYPTSHFTMHKSTPLPGYVYTWCSTPYSRASRGEHIMLLLHVPPRNRVDALIKRSR